MFKHLLVPVNFSAANRRALNIALAVAPTQERQVSVLHVIEMIADTPFEEYQGFYSRLMIQAQENMDKLLGAYRDQPLGLNPVIHYGQRAHEIVKFSAEQAVDLIVMSSHKIDPTSAAPRWDSISYRVAFLAPCPIMLVK